MSEKLYGILLQEAIPTPDKPQKIKNLLVNKEAKELLEKQSKEIERLRTLLNAKDNIIKEVREYIEKDVIVYYVLDPKLNKAFDKTNKVKKDLLEILDKENK